MGYYELPSYGPVEGCGMARPGMRAREFTMGPAAPAQPAPIATPGGKSVGPSGDPYWSWTCGPPGMEDVGGMDGVELAGQLGSRYGVCAQEFCRTRRLWGQRYNIGAIKAWIDGCNCSAKPPRCYGTRVASAAPGRQLPGAVQGFGSAFPFDPNTTPQWGESCPAGYQGVPPYCWMVDPATGLPTYPGAPGLPAATEPAVEPAPAVVPAPAPAPVPATTNGGAAATQSGASAGWWQSLSTAEKVGLVGGAALGGYLLVSLLRSKPGYTPNLRETPRLSPQGIPIIRGKRWGHLNAPKHYRKLGARRPSQYAYPKRFMYPIHDRKHVIAAKGYFTKHKRAYPMSIRRTIARNINKAARRYGLSADVKP